ncbi:imidazole glycerol phosphate synthase subunit HisF [Acidobacteriota bacterium]
MLTKRIIPCLDVKDGRVVKGIKFKDLQDAGDPVALARAYDEQGADEIILLDIEATYRSRDIMLEVVEKVSKEVFIPLTVGGGIRTTQDMRDSLNAGADKVAVCSAALKDPNLVSDGASIFGSQCMVISIDAQRTESGWSAFTNGGRNDSGRDALEWVVQVQALGAGEILLNSIDRDGTQAGYDLDLIRAVVSSISIPVIASGGAGSCEQMLAAVEEGNADAVLLASLLHYGELSIPEIKHYLSEKGVLIR